MPSVRMPHINNAITTYSPQQTTWLANKTSYQLGRHTKHQARHAMHQWTRGDINAMQTSARDQLGRTKNTRVSANPSKPMSQSQIFSEDF